MKVEIGDLKKISLKPGEVVVLTLPEGHRVRQEMVSGLTSVFPGNRVVVLEAGTSLDIVKQ